MKAHRTDGVSLTFALIFLAIAGWWLAAQFLDFALPAVGWMLAGGLILIGVLGLLGALRSGRSSAPAGAGSGGTGPVRTEPVSAPPTFDDDRPRPDDHRD
ncbi:hypothetical protein ACI2K4_12250 [Micromonospora sp. NPDC050397]|uniref:hypothetical protein n=1 Tax=Micromonospora sp. NPDC050397 TaxID=3364279 RepID=UPI00384AE352